MVKRLKKYICAALAAALFVFAQTGYVKALDALPDQITLPLAESLQLQLPFGVTFSQKQQTVLSSTDQTLTAKQQGSGRGSFRLFGVVQLRAVEVSVVQPRELFASGQLIGIAMLTDGALVVGTGRVMDAQGTWQTPADDAGLQTGDILTHIDGVKIENAATISGYLEETKCDSVTLTVLREGETLDVPLSPVSEIGSGIPRIGIWVRDSTAGVGTLTYVDQKNASYGALGHGIADGDTQVFLSVMQGKIVPARVTDIQKGEIGTPGQIHGAYALDQTPLGNVEKNNICGIFGTVEDVGGIFLAPYEIALSTQIHQGQAQLLCAVEGEVKPYACVIETIFRQRGMQTKNMVVRVTDERLLSLTGGIVQGMSGSPIIQDGKLVGAVTHVLVNDPTRGYGIFIENMLDAAG